MVIVKTEHIKSFTFTRGRIVSNKELTRAISDRSSLSTHPEAHRWTLSSVAWTAAVTRDQGIVARDEPTRSWNLRLDISRIATISKGFNWLILDAICVGCRI